MGLSIHYSGRLKTVTDLKSLIEDIKDAATIENWDYFIFNEKFENDSFSEIIDSKNLFGIMLSPVKCDPFVFHFYRMAG